MVLRGRPLHGKQRVLHIPGVPENPSKEKKGGMRGGTKKMMEPCREANDQSTHEKMHNLAGSCGNANEQNNEMPFFSYQIGNILNIDAIQWQQGGARQARFMLRWRCEQLTVFWDSALPFLLKFKKRVSFDPSSHSTGQNSCRRTIGT